jgi:hypothetical protein
MCGDGRLGKVVAPGSSSTHYPEGIDMNHTDTTPASREPVQPSRRAVLAARLATVAATVTVAAFGPGLALAEAAIASNHNEVMATRR